MADNFFTLAAKKHFGYLIHDYGFSYRGIYRNDPYGDTFIEFSSSTTVFTIRLERWDIMFTIGPKEEFENAALSLEYLFNFITSEKEKLPTPKLKSLDDYNGMNTILERYADLLRKYADMILKGDFSIWIDALRYFVNKSREIYRSITGIEDIPEAFRHVEKYINQKLSGA